MPEMSNNQKVCTRTPTCILHIGQQNKEEVKSFDNETWKRTKTACTTRLHKYSSKSKYYQICLQLKDSYADADGYHSTCYKNFTAVSGESETSSNNVTVCPQSTFHGVLRSNVHHPSTSSTGVFQRSCLFCGHVQKGAKGKKEVLGSCLTEMAEKRIKDAAVILQDDMMLAKICDIHFSAKEVKYHHSCRKSYINSADRVESTTKSTSEYAVLRGVHEDCFSVLSEYIKSSVIENQRPEFMASIHSRYMSVLQEKG